MADDRDRLSAASRALADAAAELTRALGAQAERAIPDAGEAVAQGLREAARELADVTAFLTDETRTKDERRRRKVDRTRADLLDAAARVFAARGFEGASVDDVAADAGYTKGAVYAHFGSKRELFLAVARARLAEAGDPSQHTVPGMGPAGVDVETLAGALALSTGDPQLLLAVEVLAYALRHPEDADELAGFYARAFDALVEHVADLRRARDAREGRASAPGTTQDDRDTTLGVVALLNVAPLGALLLGSDHITPAAGARVIARLLG
ncbi:TetR/AcrR family transcriptional regulator [Cellulomonas dongxiuzhuiae]|uniref:TetR/AcrR family transcriptional regulator n=1 Tax=Cellulomonas dongxiuzhuiae TaxID=2819979 RepID=UPI001AAF64F2|nr:TetR/AcrR family transcriptional regulator [Cellulomonas dongxiuzhuiae]MBO3089450.1 TetR/AcrR family transcriptional regulator [Cellulomonas dongxiuzhuiae]